MAQRRRIPGRIAACALVASLGLSASAVQARELVDGIAAQVGSDVVLISEVDELTKPMENRMRQQGARDADIEMMRSDVLDRLIDTRLVSDMVRRLELTATPEEVDGAIRGIASETGLTVEQLARSITNHGLTFDEYRVKIRGEIERSKVVSAVVQAKVRVSDSEVRGRFAERFAEQPSGGIELHLRHIVIGFGEQFLRDKDTACAIAAQGLQRIRQSEISFLALARQISNANAERGGDLGWVHTRDLAAWMAPVVAELQSGGVSEVIEMPFGCNLLQLVERREFQPVTFAQARPELEQAIYREKTEQEFTRWIDTIRAQSYIERKGAFAEATRLTRGLDGAGGP